MKRSYVLCTMGIVTICIIAVHSGYSDYVFYLCTVGTSTMYSSSVLWVE